MRELNYLKNSDLKNPITGLNKVFDNRIRLGVMSILVVNEEVSFNDLKQMLEVTDGNLATHLVSLEENGFLKVHKGFIGRKTNTTYSATKSGEKAFSDHITALENMIKGVK
jgi:DNA-binding MarR family transcriptional regulator